ncbi:START domain-containing protein 10-like [Littorina saxatilis]|uniref:START domain-containing protein 10 n=1 Tax=Littorina saxatilis TaxID=31220 RepID=A0AAN9B3T0_9CAEN
MTMPVGTVKIAEDSDFKRFKEVCDNNDGWKLEVDKQKTMVWTKANDLSDFNMVKIRSTFADVPASVMYDVIHDPQYRKTWDHSMLEGFEICVINPNNDIGYYAIKCPTPLKNRDFVTQRAWLDMGDEKIIFNHSVNHAKRPVKKGMIRGISFLTGYLIRHVDDTTCQLTYVAQSDPRGNLPAWAINKLTRILAPKVTNRIYKAAQKYPTWKAKNNPAYKPWLYPEQMMTELPRYDPADIQQMDMMASCDSLDEGSELQEGDFKDDDL